MLTKRTVQQRLGQGYRFHKMRDDLSWASDRRWMMDDGAASWEVEVDAEADAFLWSHLRASVLLLRFQEIAAERDLLSDPDNIGLWQSTEMDAYLQYNCRDAHCYGSLQDDDVELFRELVAAWFTGNQERGDGRR